MWPQPNEYVVERLAHERNAEDRRAAQQGSFLRANNRTERDSKAPAVTTRLRDLLQQVAARVAGARI
jgi:hypothetical protein